MTDANQRFEPTATVLADSSAFESRLITLEVTFHRYVLAEFNTHRMFSRNGASSRAIPVAKMIERARTANVEPLVWGKNEPGMQSHTLLEGASLAFAQQAWKIAKARAIDVAEAMVEAEVHKQIVNRILEPFLPMTMVVTGDERAYDNFLLQRLHIQAQPEIKYLAIAMKAALDESKPLSLNDGDWHLPFYSRDLAELPMVDCVKACVGRCARVSYNNHHGERAPQDDIGLYEKLVSAKPMHASPLEHVVQVQLNYTGNRGNLSSPWLQLRKQVETNVDRRK